MADEACVEISEIDVEELNPDRARCYLGVGNWRNVFFLMSH